LLPANITPIKLKHDRGERSLCFDQNSWAELMDLTSAERIELVWDSLGCKELPPMTNEEVGELDRELAEHKADPSGAQSWDQVQAWLRS
jgi:putative addiction module component (TIGR02574 family)